MRMYPLFFIPISIYARSFLTYRYIYILLFLTYRYIYILYIYIYLVIYITSYFVIHIHDTYRDIDIKLLRDRLHAINRKNFESFCFLKISYIMTD